MSGSLLFLLHVVQALEAGIWVTLCGLLREAFVVLVRKGFGCVVVGLGLWGRGVLLFGVGSLGVVKEVLGPGVGEEVVVEAGFHSQGLCSLLISLLVSLLISLLIHPHSELLHLTRILKLLGLIGLVRLILYGVRLGGFLKVRDRIVLHRFWVSQVAHDLLVSLFLLVLDVLFIILLLYHDPHCILVHPRQHQLFGELVLPGDGLSAPCPTALLQLFHAISIS